MTERNTNLTAERLRELLHYDPATGVFIWRNSTGRAPAGAEAGTVRKKTLYRTIRIDGRIHYAHRLAWLYVHGALPRDQIDHRRGKSNAILNLRLASSTQNKCNTMLRENNSSGYKGVSRKRGKWRARIKAGERYVLLGHFGDPVEAAKAYDAAALKNFGQYARTNAMLGLIA